jgi:hypothetical protein
VSSLRSLGLLRAGLARGAAELTRARQRSAARRGVRPGCGGLRVRPLTSLKSTCFLKASIRAIWTVRLSPRRMTRRDRRPTKLGAAAVERRSHPSHSRGAPGRSWSTRAHRRRNRSCAHRSPGRHTPRAGRSPTARGESEQLDVLAVAFGVGGIAFGDREMAGGFAEGLGRSRLGSKEER